MIIHGDCLTVLRTLDADSIEACVTDPPYGIGFMGREWDTFKPGIEQSRIVPNRAIESDNPNLKGRTRGPASSPSAVEYDYTAKGLRAFQAFTEQWAVEVLRVLKPGAYLLVCGAPRSYHRMACGLEDAGFVIRDKFSWLFGSGFPKNYNLGDGKGTALKPAHEPIALAWKPFKGSIKACHAQHGTAALNIDECRIGYISNEDRAAAFPGGRTTSGSLVGGESDRSEFTAVQSDLGRWPSNVLLDEFSAAALDEMTGELTSGEWTGQLTGATQTRGVEIYGAKASRPYFRERDAGGASRFFYVAKPSREERDFGTHGLAARQRDESRKEGNPGGDNPRNRGLQPRGNFHPTVKPVELMRWLVRLVTPRYVRYCPQCDNHNGTQETGDVRSLREVRRDVHCGSQEGQTDAAILRPKMFQSGNGSNTCEHEGLFDQHEGLSAGLFADASDGGSRRISDGAQADNGGASWPNVDIRGSGSPHQRTEGGQPAGKSGSDVVAAAQQSKEAAEETDPMSSLPRSDQNFGTCPACGGNLAERPGCVLDPFLGSGTTGMACRYEHRQFIGIEREADYIKIAERRIAAVAPLFGEENTA